MKKNHQSKLIFGIIFCIAITGNIGIYALPADSVVIRILKDSIEKKQGVFGKTDTEVEIKFDISKLAPSNVRIIFNNLFKQYLTIKDALAYSDAFSAKRNTLTLLEQMKSKTKDVDIINKDDRWILFLHNYDNIRYKVEAADFISEQRFLFSEISRGIQEFIKYYGLYDKTIYFMYCKNDEKNINGSWLSDSRDKKNPYLGSINDTSCTKVKEVWIF